MARFTVNTPSNSMRRAKNAFVWIVRILRENKILFRISGGFAVKIYGSGRTLADIDIDVPRKDMELIKYRVFRYIIYGPERYRDRNWDLYLMTLQVFGQKIDICAAETERIYDKNKSMWVPLHIDLRNAVKKKVFGKIVPVASPNELIVYKSKLQRRVDIRDITYLRGLYGS